MDTIDAGLVCVHFAHMARKTISIDTDVYRRLKKLQTPHETFSATLRRMLEEEKDPAAYLEDLLQNPPKVDVALLRRRQSRPRPSHRPARANRGRRAA